MGKARDNNYDPLQSDKIVTMPIVVRLELSVDEIDTLKVRAAINQMKVDQYVTFLLKRGIR